jgi:hypothetical protein
MTAAAQAIPADGAIDHEALREAAVQYDMNGGRTAASPQNGTSVAQDVYAGIDALLLAQTQHEAHRLLAHIRQALESTVPGDALPRPRGHA